MVAESCCSLVLIHQAREQKGSITSSHVAARTSPCIPCAQFLAAEAEASAIAALVKAEQLASEHVQQQQAEPLAAAEAAGAAVHEVASGAAPVSEAETPPAPPPVAKEPEVAPAPQPAAWNVLTGGSLFPMKHYHAEKHMNVPGISAHSRQCVHSPGGTIARSVAAGPTVLTYTYTNRSKDFGGGSLSSGRTRWSNRT